MAVIVVASGLALLIGLLSMGMLLGRFDTGVDPRELGVIVPLPPTGTCQQAAAAANPIVAENTCPGTNSWRMDHALGLSTAINAFSVPTSVNVGKQLKLYVSTSARTYTFRIYRVGWYQGHGARLLYTSPKLHGIDQPAPMYDATTHAASCANWSDPVTLRIPTQWVSGVYLVKLFSSDGDMRYTLFVVRNDASHAPILAQIGLMTYQAYNTYGGAACMQAGRRTPTIRPSSLAARMLSRSIALTIPSRAWQTSPGGTTTSSAGWSARATISATWRMSTSSSIPHPSPSTS
jgi:hypothetical protein